MALSFTFTGPDGTDGWRRMRINDAGPREVMGAALLRQLLHLSPWAKRQGDVLTIWDDFGNRYVYEVGDYDYQLDSYQLTLLERSRTAAEE